MSATRIYRGPFNPQSAQKQAGTRQPSPVDMADGHLCTWLVFVGVRNLALPSVAAAGEDSGRDSGLGAENAPRSIEAFQY